MNFMVNQMNKLQKNRKNKNKGFTLVELIIVIAIIAVLAAVLAPQYIKYVEKSRASTDVDTVGVIGQAVNVLVADGTVTSAETFTWDTTSGGISSNLTAGGHATDVTNITGTVNAAKSTKGKAQDVTFAVAIDSDTGVASVTIDPSTYQTWAN